MRIRLLILPFMLCLWGMAVAQDDSKPGWLKNKPKAGNSSYVYVVEHGGGARVSDAVEDALQKVLRTTMMRIGSNVGWDVVYKALKGGADWSDVAMQYNIPVNKVCEYVERKTDKGYVVAVLCQVAKSGAEYPEFDDFTACNDTKSYSDIDALWKSALVPGLGQIGKNHKVLGFSVMGIEAALGIVTVIFYFHGTDRYESVYQSYNSFIGGSESAASYLTEYLVEYNEDRKKYYTFLSAAAVVYAFNLVQAYMMKPRYKLDGIAFSPVIIPAEGSFATGFGLTLSF